MYQIAIDGPSGAGKSTIARMLAEKLGCVYVDTGAMYRTIGLYILRKKIARDNPEAIEKALDGLKIDIKYIDKVQRMFLCGEDVTGLIRTQEISMYASSVSAIPAVRAFLIDPQRKFARENNVVMDGRDIGTVILPSATVKIFLTSTSEARAKRRFTELLAKGEQVDYNVILAQTIERDNNDMSRAIAPAVAAKDAVVLDNSELDVNETFEAVLGIVNKRLCSD